MFNTITEVYDWLFNQKKLNKRENLDRIKKCVELLDIKTNYKIIHIAGTNGKGSTASYIKNILKLTNKHIGFFISPFVISFNERIQINDRYISNAEIMHYANKIYKFSSSYYKEYNDIIPFFELTLLMALMYFQDRDIDIAIIECGMGGLLDATNFINPDISIITNIGFEHMNSLGNTKEEIALHKLGIIKPNKPVLTTVDDELKNMFLEYANKLNSNITFVDQYVSDIKVSDMTYFKYKGINYQSSLLAKYQAYNASLAIEAVKYIDDKITDDIINIGLSTNKWPGRMEIISKKPFIMIDGAHNIHGIEALVDSLNDNNFNKKIKIMFSALADKEFNKMINHLDKITDYYYFTTINDARATNVMEFSKYTSKNYSLFNDYKEAINKAKSELKGDEMLIITGSLHFISLVREYLINK